MLLTLPLLLLPVQEDAYTPFVEEASDEGRAAMAGFEIPDGFSVDLWAAEPMLANPVIFHIDHAGDVYVCESFRVHAGVTDMRSHMDWLEDELDNLTVEDRVDMYRRQEGEEGFAAYGTEHERLRLLRDTDGDGKADHAVVFADGFNDPADGIAAGVLSYRGDVFYTCIPHLWRLRDLDGDDVADERDALSSGYGVHVALLGHDMHGLVIGPDGRLYWSIGDRGYHVEHEGNTFTLPHTGAVFRSELDGSNLEVVHTGLRNPQELVFDDRGDLFTGDNNSDGGDEARWVQIIEGADTGWRFYYQYVTSPVLRGPWNDELLWKPWHEGQPAYIVPPIANLANGPSGLEYYPGTGLPDEYAGHFFLCDFRGDAGYSGVHTYTNIEKGAGFELGPVERFVWNTLVTDCQFGPDGAFYWSDWVHGWGMTGKGRMYRMTHPAADAEVARETEAILTAGVAGESDARLRELMSHADKRVRQEAHLELARRGATATLGQAALHGTGRERLHGLWGLGAVGRWHAQDRELVVGTLLALLLDEDSELRAQSARILGDLRPEAAGPALVQLLETERRSVQSGGTPAARVQHHAAIALGKLGYAEAKHELTSLVRSDAWDDPVLRHAAVMGLTGCLTREDIEAALNGGALGERVGEWYTAQALVLRRWRDPMLARFLSPPEVFFYFGAGHEAVIAIHDERIEGAIPALADLITVTTEQGFRGGRTVRRALNANLWLGGEDRARALTTYALRADQDEAHRAEAFEILREWADPSNIDRVTGSWIDLPPRDASYVPALLAAIDAEVVAQPPAVLDAWIEACGAVGADVAATLSALVGDRAHESSTRTAALRALEGLGAGELRAAVALALSDGDGLVRAAGLDALGRLDAADALPILSDVVATGEIAERRVAYRTLGAMQSEAANAILRRELVKLRADLIPSELVLDYVMALEACGDATLAAEVTARTAARAQADAELAPYLDSLFGGDAARGRRIFREKSELSCLRCHQTTDDGSPQIGPNLAGLTSRMTRLSIAESIVAPNRRVAAGYETETFFFLDGQVLEGRVVEESAEALVLVDSQGDLWDVDLAEVEERRAGLSAMPANLTEHLSREELRDLLAYLTTL